MLAEYLSYWGFQRSPFSLSPDPDMLYPSAQHQEALLRLKYGVMSNKGGVLLVSENAGDGKTSILRRLVTDLEAEYEGRIRIAFIDHPTLTVNQMVAEIARQLGVARVRKEKIDNLNALRVKLQAFHEAGTRCAVIVDEGQMLAHKPDILQELRILLNFCVSDAFLLSFVLSGQKPLEEAVKRMPEFWQRLPVRFFLKNLDARDTAALVRHRVRLAGQHQRDIFTPTALEGIHRASQGCPRVICTLADLSLLIGHSLRSQNVDFREVSQATNDLGKNGEPFHYYSFITTATRSKPKARRRCASCRRFLAAAATNCPRCGAEAPATAPVAADPVAPPAPPTMECPACRHKAPLGPRCTACGLVLTQACPRCQQPSLAEAGACDRCGCRLSGREALAARELEQGLRRLGIEPPAAEVARRFPVLQKEGRVFMGSVASRFPWGRKSQLQTLDQTASGSFFMTERSLVFANGSATRRIPYGAIRKMSVSLDDRRGGFAQPRLRILLDQEEVRLAFPVETDRPSELAALVSHFVANKRALSGADGGGRRTEDG